jgi:hypothetical protein
MGSTLTFAVAILCSAHVTYGQQTVCDLFQDLKALDGKRLELSGEFVVYDDEVTVLASSECDRRYMDAHHGSWVPAVQLRASAGTAPVELEKLIAATEQMSRLRDSGQLMTSQATVSGQLRIAQLDSFPAEFVFDTVKSVTVEALSDPKDLPVISICDLFQDLESWRGKRIAVRAEFSSSMEGNWILGRRNGALSTNGYHWPVSLSYAPPEYSPNVPPSLEAFGIQEDRRRVNQVQEPQTATFIGRLYLRDKYSAVCNRFGTYWTNGFDHLNGATGRLLVEAIRDVTGTTFPPGVTNFKFETQKCEPDKALQ